MNKQKRRKEGREREKVWKRNKPRELNLHRNRFFQLKFLHLPDKPDLSDHRRPV